MFDAKKFHNYSPALKRNLETKMCITGEIILISRIFNESLRDMHVQIYYLQQEQPTRHPPLPPMILDYCHSTVHFENCIESIEMCSLQSSFFPIMVSNYKHIKRVQKKILTPSTKKNFARIATPQPSKTNFYKKMILVRAI